MGVFTLSESVKSDIRAHNIALAQAYKTYRLLLELAPFLTQERLTEGRISVEKINDMITVGKHTHYKDAHITTLLIELKKQRNIDQKTPFTSDDLEKLISSPNVIITWGDTLGLKITQSDFTKTDGTTMSDFKEIAEMLLRKKIMPAMHQYKWERNEILAVAILALVVTFYIVSFSMKIWNPSLLEITSTLAGLSILLLVNIINKHHQGQMLAAKLGSENRKQIDAGIRDIANSVTVYHQPSIKQVSHEQSSAATQNLSILSKQPIAEKPIDNKVIDKKVKKPFFSFSS